MRKFYQKNTRAISERNVVSTIYKRYLLAYLETPQGPSKTYFPINLDQIAKDLKTDSNIVFGILYYVLQTKYEVKEITTIADGKTRTNIRTGIITAGKDEYDWLINFPYIAMLHAELEEVARHKFFNMTASGVAVVISLIALAVSIARSD